VGVEQRSHRRLDSAPGVIGGVLKLAVPELAPRVFKLLACVRQPRIGEHGLPLTKLSPGAK
jgi:hypothetical protein